MTRKRYYFNDLSEDNVLYPLAQTAKDTLQHNESVVKTYQKYDALYGQSPSEASFLMGLNNLLFSSSLANFLSGPQHGRVSSSPETSDQALYTLLRGHSSVPPKHLSLVGEKNAASLNQTTSPEKLSTIDNKDDVSLVKDANAFIPVKRCKHVTNDQGYVNSDEMTKMLASSAQQDKRIISSNRESKAIKVFGGKRKSPCPMKDTMIFRSMPRFIHSSGTVEIETDIFSKSVEFSSTTSYFSPTDYESAKTITDSKGKKRSPTDVHFSMDESKAGISQDFSLSPNSTLPSSPIIAKTNDSSFLQIDIIDVGDDGLPFEPSKGSLLINRSLETASSRINNMEPYAVRYCIKQLYTLLQLTDEYMNQFPNSLIDFQNDLRFLYSFMENIQYVGHNALVNKNCIKPTEELRKNIFELATEASRLTGQIGSWEMEVDQEIPNWVIYFEEIRELKSGNEPLMYNSQPLVPIEFLKKYEEDVKTILRKVNDMINIIDARIKLFLTTAHDLVKLVNLFVECLIYIGILKPSPTSML